MIAMSNFKESIHMHILNNHSDWLDARSARLGGSDAATVLGLNPYKDNQQLWAEKTGRRNPEDISEKPYVKYGTQAEPMLRELFKLDYPQYKVDYCENNLFTNANYPFAHASLDGWLTDEEGRKGILEIKTTEIVRSGQTTLWNGRVPDNYYVQLLHYLMVTEAEFAILKAQLKFDFAEGLKLSTQHYVLERSDCEEEIEYLKNKEQEFWQHVVTDTEPALILPEL